MLVNFFELDPIMFTLVPLILRLEKIKISLNNFGWGKIKKLGATQILF